MLWVKVLLVCFLDFVVIPFVLGYFMDFATQSAWFDLSVLPPTKESYDIPPSQDDFFDILADIFKSRNDGNNATSSTVTSLYTAIVNASSAAMGAAKDDLASSSYSYAYSEASGSLNAGSNTTFGSSLESSHTLTSPSPDSVSSGDFFSSGEATGALDPASALGILEEHFGGVAAFCSASVAIVARLARATLGRAYSAGVSNVGVYAHETRHGDLSITRVHFGISQARGRGSGALPPTSHGNAG